MIKLAFYLGLTITLGSGAVLYDYSKQAAQNPGEITNMSLYGLSLQNRVVDLMKRDPGPRIAALPQVSRPMATTRSFSAAPRSTEQDIDDFIKDSPQLQAMVKADRAKQKESFWSRIRQKVTGEDGAQRTDRLAAIQKRNKPAEPYDGITPDDLADMSPGEIYQNRAAMGDYVKSMMNQHSNGF